MRTMNSKTYNVIIGIDDHFSEHDILVDIHQSVRRVELHFFANSIVVNNCNRRLGRSA
jgi:hypothetical protein